MRVALFIPCYVDLLTPRVGQATLALLERYGLDVEFPRAQTCCGQPMANLGCRADALPLARRFLRVFGDDRFDHVVAPSGSCVAMVRHHYRDLLTEPAERAQLESLCARTRELCEFLVDVLAVDALPGRYPHRVGLQRACHGLRELGLGTPSERVGPKADKVAGLLASIEGLELVDLQRRDECCGFGGTFAVSEEAVSCGMGRDRIADHLRSGAEVMTSTDVSCLLHLGGLALRSTHRLPMLHVAELFDAAQQARSDGDDGGDAGSGLA